MFGHRVYFSFGIAGLGFAVALTLSHLGLPVFAPVALAAAAFAAVPLFPRDLFRIVAERLPALLGPAVLYGALARRLAVSAGIVLHLISASISAAGVGLLAMLPIGARIDDRRHRAGFSPA